MEKAGDIQCEFFTPSDTRDENTIVIQGQLMRKIGALEARTLLAASQPVIHGVTVYQLTPQMVSS